MIETKTNTGSVRVLVKFWPFWLFAFLFQTAGALHYTFLPIFGEMILPIWLVGLLMGGSALVQLVLDVPIGFALDKFGYTRLLKFGVFFFIVGALSLTLGLSPSVFITTLFFSALGWLVFGPGVDAYVLSQAPKEYAGRFMGFHSISLSAGTVVAVSIFALMADQSIVNIGLVVSAVLLSALVFLLLTKPDKISVQQQEKKIPTQNYHVRRHYIPQTLKALRRLNPASTMLLLTGFASAVFYAIIWFVIPLIVVEGYTDNRIVSLGLGIFDLTVVVLGALIGYIADRYNKEWLVFFGLLLFATAGVLIGFNLSLWFLVLGFLAAAGDELTSVSLWAWMNHLDKDHAEDGVVSGAIVLFNDLGWAVGPILGGVLYSTVGPSLAIATGATVVLIVWFTYTLMAFGNPVLRLAKLAHHPHKPRRRKFKH